MNDLFNQKVTIYNDIPSDGVNARRFDRFVIDLCNIQKGILQNADGTIEKVVNAITITTKDTEHYKPSLEYRYLPIDEKEKYYTVQVNDVIIFGEVDDVAKTRRELDTMLEEKYKNNGFLVTAVNEYLNRWRLLRPKMELVLHIGGRCLDGLFQAKGNDI